MCINFLTVLLKLKSRTLCNCKEKSRPLMRSSCAEIQSAKTGKLANSFAVVGFGQICHKMASSWACRSRGQNLFNLLCLGRVYSEACSLRSWSRTVGLCKVTIHPDFTGTVRNFDRLCRGNCKVSWDAELSGIPNPVPILSHFKCNVTSHVDEVYNYTPYTYTKFIVVRCVLSRSK